MRMLRPAFNRLLLAGLVALAAGGCAAVMGKASDRLASNLGMMSAMEAFKRLFGSRSLAVNWLRNTGMRRLNSISAIKKIIINTALGVS